MKTFKRNAAAMSLAIGTMAALLATSASADEVVVTATPIAAAPDANEIQIDIADYVRSISASLQSALESTLSPPVQIAEPVPNVEVASVEGRTRG